MYNPVAILNRLCESIDAELSHGNSISVHTIQLIAATGEILAEPVSYFLSREPEKYESCVRQFTRYDATANTFERSLATEEITKPPGYRLTDLSPATSGNRELASGQYQFRIQRGWDYRPLRGKDDKHAFDDWLQVLAGTFQAPVSTLWVTQRCLPESNAPISAAFVLFSGIVTANVDRLFTVAKLLRDALVAQLVTAHEEIIKHQQNIQVALMQHVLSESSSDMPLAPEVRDQIHLYARALGSEIPILIIGEAGTGKLAAAHEIHRRREEYLRQHGAFLNGPHIENPLVTVRATELGHTAAEARQKLEDALRRCSITKRKRTKVAPPRSPVIVIDDVQLASAGAQDELARRLDQIIPSVVSDPDERRVKIIFTALPGLDALVAAGAFNASLYAQMSAFEVTCPPLRDRLSDERDRDRVLRYAVRAISSALQLPACPELPRKEIEHIMRQHWPANFRDLNNHLIRVLLEAPVAKGVR